MPERIRTACNRDCPDACSVLVEVEQGRAIALRGDPEDPVTAGFLCERTSHFLERQYAPERFTGPLLRRDGRLQPIGWEEALDLAAAKLRAAKDEFGPASILHYRAGGSLGILKAVADHVFESFGPVSLKRGDICSGAGEAAQERDFGVADSNDLFDLDHSRCILIWGKNPHVSGVHLLPVLRRAKKRGAVLLGIDPVRTRCAELCDDFLQPRPGSDPFLALAMARHLLDSGRVDEAAVGARSENLDGHLRLLRSRRFEEWLEPTEVTPEAARRFAEHYAEGPSALLVGWGMARRRNGSAAVRCMDALGVLSGNVGVRGGGVSYYFARRGPFELGFLQGREARSFAEARLGEEILAAQDPPVRVAWVTAGNPVSMLPDSTTVQRALREVDFTVVVDTHPTDTTDVADLILPTRTLLEDDDVVGAYGNHWLRESRPTVAAPADCWHEVDIHRALARRLGLEGLVPETVEECKRVVLRRLEEAGVRRQQLEQGPVRSPFAPEVAFEQDFATPSGKARLIDELPVEPMRTTSQRPLRLMAISHPQAQSSQWTDALRDRPLECRVHPDAAAGLAEGDRVRVVSERGAVEARLVLDATLRPDLAVLPKGGMLRDGRGVNALIAAEETDAGGGAVYYDTLVGLEALQPEPIRSEARRPERR